MKNIYILLLLVSVTAIAIRYTFRDTPAAAAANGPTLYGLSSGGVLYKIDPMTCTVCPVITFNNISSSVDVVVLPDGRILVNDFDGLRLYELPNPNPIWTDNIPCEGSVLAPNGLVYLSSYDPNGGLSVFDPATNTVTFIGLWPTNYFIGEFFYQNGVLYANGTEQTGPSSTPSRVFEINLNNPGLTTIVVSNPPSWTNGGFANGGYNTSTSPNNILRQYDVTTNTLQTVCTLPVPTGVSGLSTLPFGVPEPPCQCLTNAGTVNTSVFNICVPGSVTVPYNNDATLDGNDILRYILFSNPSDTLGSIIIQSSSATIPYNPATMQTSVPYYLATLAGNNQGGNVNLSDPCLDISNTAAQVIWRPRPTVTFTVANPNICAGECRTVTATFVGTPPFNLTYTTPVGTVTQVFSGNTSSFQVCAPAGASAGALGVQATNLTDAWCGCL
jgi:hypothetical protein